MAYSKGRSGAAWNATRKRLRTPDAICYLCSRPINIELKFPNRWSFSVHHIDGDKDNNDDGNHAPAHLRCNSIDGNRRGRRGRPRPRTVTVITSRNW